MTECEDYHCRCDRFVDDGSGYAYCVCGCTQEDHGLGFRAQEQASADQGRAVVEQMLGRRLPQN